MQHINRLFCTFPNKIFSAQAIQEKKPNKQLDNKLSCQEKRKIQDMCYIIGCMYIAAVPSNRVPLPAHSNPPSFSDLEPRACFLNNCFIQKASITKYYGEN